MKLYKLTAQYFHGGTTKREDYSEIFYYINAESFKQAIEKFEKNLAERQKDRPQCDEKIYEIKEADPRIGFIS